MATTTEEALVAHHDDAEVEKRVRLYLAAKRPELGQLSVSADHGTVRLTGPLSSFYVRQLALSVASRVAGVRSIVDDIEVPVPQVELEKRRPR